VGIGMVVTGGMAAVTGAIWALIALGAEYHSPTGPTASERQSLTGAGFTAAAGLAVCMGGWIVFGTNHAAFHTSTDYPWRRVSLGVAPTEKGWTGVVGVTF
jgi:hypothetical protein